MLPYAYHSLILQDAVSEESTSRRALHYMCYRILVKIKRAESEPFFFFKRRRNATQVATVSQKKYNRGREFYLAKLRGRGFLQKGFHSKWIPLKKGSIQRGFPSKGVPFKGDSLQKGFHLKGIPFKGGSLQKGFHSKGITFKADSLQRGEARERKHFSPAVPPARETAA